MTKNQRKKQKQRRLAHAQAQKDRNSDLNCKDVLNYWMPEHGLELEYTIVGGDNFKYSEYVFDPKAEVKASSEFLNSWMAEHGFKFRDLK